MRIASRHMPKFKPSLLGPSFYVLLSLMAAAILYVAISSPPLAAFATVSLFFAILLARKAVKRDAAQLCALATTRKGESICEFAKAFDAREVDTWIVRAVYEQIQCQLQHVHAAFPVRASDLLKDDLHLDDDDIDLGLAIEIEQRTGRTLDNTKANPYLGKVKTVRDLVMFFQAQPRANKAEGESS